MNEANIKAATKERKGKDQNLLSEEILIGKTVFPYEMPNSLPA